MVHTRKVLLNRLFLAAAICWRKKGKLKLDLLRVALLNCLLLIEEEVIANIIYFTTRTELITDI